MTFEIFQTIIILALIGLIFYKEKRQEKIIREILIFKLSKDVVEFKTAIQEPEKERERPEEEVLPIEEAPPEQLLEALNK